MAGWHHGLDGRESERTLGEGDGQGGLVCCDSWGRKELDTTEVTACTDAPWNIYSNAMGFPVVMYGCESWAVKKAEH